MKKSLLFMAFLFILGGLCGNAAELTDKISNPNANVTYGDFTITGLESGTEYLFAKTNKQQDGFYQIRHSKSSYITNKTTIGNLKSISLNLKAGKINIYGSNEAYTSYAQTPTNGTKVQTVETVGQNTIPFVDTYKYFYIVSDGTTISKIADIEFVWDNGGSDIPAEPVAYEPNFARVELYEGEISQIDLGAKHPTKMTFASDNENAATVSTEGVITAVGIGKANISVSWEKDDNFLASETPASFEVEVFEKPLMFTWTVTGIQTGSTKGQKVNSALLTEGANGVWTAVSPENCYSATDGGVHLGSSATTFTGTITLSGSDIPANAIITKVAMSAKGAKDASSTWSVSVNGNTAAETLSYTTTTFENKEIGVNLTGNEIVLTCTEATENKAVYINGITVCYALPECPYTEEELTPSHAEGTVTLGANGTAVVEIENGNLEGVTIHYSTPVAAAENAPLRAVSHEGFTEAALVDGVHTFTVKNPGVVTYYGYHKDSDTKGVERTLTVKPYDDTTAIDAIGADAFEGEVEFFDIRGVKVNIDNAAPGLYIRRQGTTATKVIVK